MVFPYTALWFLPGWAAILNFKKLPRLLRRVSNLGLLYLWSQRFPSLSYPRGFCLFALRLFYLQKDFKRFLMKAYHCYSGRYGKAVINILWLFHKYDYFCVCFKRENSDWGVLRLVWMLPSLSYLNVSF